MTRNIDLVLGIALCLVFMSSGLVFTQDIQTPQEGSIPESQAEAEALWLWGEVVSVDIQKKELGVKYLDYEIDQEKEITIDVDEKTTYENIKSLDEIKPKDTVSIDYTISANGKNIAKNIVVEKSEETIESVPAEEIPPEKTESPPSVGQ